MAEDNIDGKTLQVEIVKRFMSDAEWHEFQKEYWNSRFTQQAHNRAGTLGREIDPEGLEMLKAYTQETDVTYKELKKRFQGRDIAYQAGRTALKIIYQHPEVLKRI